MLARTKFAGVWVLAALLLGAVMASGASAAKVKPKLVLKTADEGKKDGTPVSSGSTVAAGWFVGFLAGNPNEEIVCQVFPQEGEQEGSMVLTTNESTKADKATGSVAPPPCGELEETGTEEFKFKKVTSVSLSGGPLKGQVIDIKKNAGTIELSKALILQLEPSAGTKCAYESKTKIKATWPPEENPNFPFITDTANLTAELALKLDKSLSAKTGCGKTEKVLIETWLGPLGEELEAELT